MVHPPQVVFVEIFGVVGYDTVVAVPKCFPIYVQHVLLSLLSKILTVSPIDGLPKSSQKVSETTFLFMALG